MASGDHLLNPDFKEDGSGHLHIESGAYIYFGKLDSDAPNIETLLKKTLDDIEHSQLGYSQSAEISNVADSEVIMIEGGHTTRDVIFYYQTPSGQWLRAGMATTTGKDGQYDPKISPHYKTFLSWLEDLIRLNP